MTIKKDVVVFDLDGTLADIEHRRHLVEGKEKDWNKFFAECVNDTPNWPVIRSAHAHFTMGAEIWVVSGRSEVVRKETEAWLKEHFLNDGQYKLVMRPAYDTTPDDVLKMKWLSEGTIPSKDRILACYDDRDKVVKAWRSAGVPCFQVAPGDF